MSKDTKGPDSTSSSPKTKSEGDGETVTSTQAPSTVSDATAAATACDGPKKKRSAEDQITKDDYDPEDLGDDGEYVLSQGFQRAPTEVLKARKIYKVNRSTFKQKTGASTSTENGKTDDCSGATKSETNDCGTTEKPSATIANPFATTALVDEKKSNDGVETKSPFTFAFSSSNDNKNCNSSPSSKKVFGFGSEGGFGSIGSGTSNGKACGFGSARTENSKGWFGAKAEEGKTGNSNSPFSKLQFKFKCNNDASSMGKSSINAPQLPENVELKTGEEDEQVIYTQRCKSWVSVHNKDEPSATNGASSSNSKIGKANPSVKPSTEFQAAISSSKSKRDESESTVKKNKNENAESPATENGKKNNPNSNTEVTKNDNENVGDESSNKERSTCEKDESDKAQSSSQTSTGQEHHRWQELGVGPMKILKSTTQPDRLRLVQRRESTKNGPATKVILNVPLWKETTCVRDTQEQNFSRLNTFENGKVCTYLFKFQESNVRFNEMYLAPFNDRILKLLIEIASFFLSTYLSYAFLFVS